jgi:hypothetical protein
VPIYPVVPYLVYLARGRDTEQPAVIVLLDSDKPGDDALKVLRRGGPRQKQLLRQSLIVQVGNVPGIRSELGASVSIDDLVPLEIAVRAARRYGRDICDFDEDDCAKVNAGAIRSTYRAQDGLYPALAGTFSAAHPNQPHLDKVGFARFVLDEVVSLRGLAGQGDDEAGRAVDSFDRTFKALFSRLNQMRRDAERESRGERVSSRVERAKRSFILDHPTSATREHAAILLEDIEAVLDKTLESDEIRNEVQRLRRDFQLDVDPKEPVADLEAFKQQLERLKDAGRLASQEPSSTAATASSGGSRAPSEKSVGADGAAPERLASVPVTANTLDGNGAQPA